jgi:hypothetical protein
MKKLGFHILTYQEPGQFFLKLLDRLRELPNVDIVLHHDTHQSSFPQEIVEKYQLKLVEQPRRTYWSHLNNVLATFDALFLLYNQPNPPDWYIALTPNCYPIKKIEEIVNFFENTELDYYMENREVVYGKPVIDIDEYIADAFYKREIAKIPFISKKGNFYWRSIKKSRKNVPFNETFKLYHGSNWMMFNHKTMQAIAEQNPYEHFLVKFYKENITGTNQHPCPQEVIIPCLIRNAPISLKGDNNYAYRYINWEGAKDWHPNTLTLKHLEAILKSDALFARKFSDKEGDELVNYIDKNILKIN